MVPPTDATRVALGARGKGAPKAIGMRPGVAEVACQAAVLRVLRKVQRWQLSCQVVVINRQKVNPLQLLQVRRNGSTQVV